jgi:hypothetical protein
MILPDGSMKEGFFSNNIFYGENSPETEDRLSYIFKSPGTEKFTMSKNFSQSSLIDRA